MAKKKEEKKEEQKDVRFSCNVGVLSKAFRYAMAKGTMDKGVSGAVKGAYFNDCVIKIDRGIAVIRLLDQNEILYARVEFKANSLSNGDGLMPIDLEDALKVLERIDNDSYVIVKYDGSVVSIEIERDHPRLKFVLPICPIDEIKDCISEDQFKKNDNSMPEQDGIILDTKIIVEASEFKEIVKDGSQIRYLVFPFVVSKNRNEVVVSVANEKTSKKIEREINAEIVSISPPGDDVDSIYTRGFGNAVEGLTGKLSIYLRKDGPICIEATDVGINIQYVVVGSDIKEINEDLEVNLTELDEAVDGVKLEEGESEEQDQQE